MLQAGSSAGLVVCVCGQTGQGGRASLSATSQSYLKLSAWPRPKHSFDADHAKCKHTLYTYILANERKQEDGRGEGEHSIDTDQQNLWRKEKGGEGCVKAPGWGCGGAWPGGCPGGQ